MHKYINSTEINKLTHAKKYKHNYTKPKNYLGAKSLVLQLAHR